MMEENNQDTPSDIGSSEPDDMTAGDSPPDSPPDQESGSRIPKTIESLQILGAGQPYKGSM